jgi:hypothetical protein
MMRKDRTGAGPLISMAMAPMALPSARVFDGTAQPRRSRHGLCDRPYPGGDDLGRRWYKDGKLDSAPTRSTISSMSRAALSNAA